MKKSLIFMLVVALLSIGLWLAFSDKSFAQPSVVESETTPQSQIVTTNKQPILSNKKDIKVSIAQKQFDDSIKQAAQQVSQQYAAALQFPQYSQPLTRFDSDRLEPNKFHPVSVPLQQGGDLVMSVSHYRIVYPEPIEVKVEGANVSAVTLNLLDVDNKKVIETKRGSRQGTGFITSFSGKEDYPRNLQVLATVEVDNNEVPIAAQLQYMQPSAVLVGFEQAWPDNDNMAIPASLKVHKSGLYRLRANLFVGKEPIAHLVSRERLETGTQEIELKAHWSVLKNSSQPMSLSGFVIELMSPAPGEPSVFGQSEIDSFEILAFPFDSLQKTPYQASDAERQSLNFLKQLGGES